MAKKDLKVAPAVETLKPYLDRALSDKEFREDLKEALGRRASSTGRSSKDARDDGPGKSASRLATDEKVQENLRNALEEFGKAAGTLKGKKKRATRAAMRCCSPASSRVRSTTPGPARRRVNG